MFASRGSSSLRYIDWIHEGRCWRKQGKSNTTFQVSLPTSNVDVYSHHLRTINAKIRTNSDIRNRPKVASSVDGAFSLGRSMFAFSISSPIVLWAPLSSMELVVYRLVGHQPPLWLFTSMGWSSHSSFPISKMTVFWWSQLFFANYRRPRSDSSPRQTIDWLLFDGEDGNDGGTCSRECELQPFLLGVWRGAFFVPEIRQLSLGNY